MDLAGEDWVGRKIEVYQLDDARWETAVVVEYFPSVKRWEVRYEDGRTQLVSETKHTIRFLDLEMSDADSMMSTPGAYMPMSPGTSAQLQANLQREDNETKAWLNDLEQHLGTQGKEKGFSQASLRQDQVEALKDFDGILEGAVHELRDPEFLVFGKPSASSQTLNSVAGGEDLPFVRILLADAGSPAKARAVAGHGLSMLRKRTEIWRSDISQQTKESRVNGQFIWPNSTFRLGVNGPSGRDKRGNTDWTRCSEVILVQVMQKRMAGNAVLGTAVFSLQQLFAPESMLPDAPPLGSVGADSTDSSLDRRIAHLEAAQNMLGQPYAVWTTVELTPTDAVGTAPGQAATVSAGLLLKLHGIGREPVTSKDNGTTGSTGSPGRSMAPHPPGVPRSSQTGPNRPSQNGPRKRISVSSGRPGDRGGGGRPTGSAPAPTAAQHPASYPVRVAGHPEPVIPRSPRPVVRGATVSGQSRRAPRAAGSGAPRPRAVDRRTKVCVVGQNVLNALVDCP